MGLDGGGDEGEGVLELSEWSFLSVVAFMGRERCIVV